MGTRRLIVTGMGFTLLTSGCGLVSQLEPQAEDRPRERFEVTPSGVGPERAAVASRRPRLDAGAAEGDSSGAPLAPAALPADMVHQRVEAQRRALEAAHAVAPTDEPAAPQPTGSSAVKWLGPDRSGPPGAAHAPETAARPLPAPSADEVKPSVAAVDADPSAANLPTQIAHPPAVPPAPPAAIPAAVPPAAPTPSTNAILASGHEPVVVTTSVDPDAWGHKFEQMVRDYPSDLSANLDHELMRFLRDETVPQMDSISGLSAEDHELLAALLDGLSNFRNGLRADKNMLLTQKVKPILDLADRVRSQAELTIPTLAVCSKVQGFGVYEPMPSNLKAGVDNPLIIYSEVQNFSSRQNEKTFWETKLSQEAVLYTESGLAVWRDKSDIPVDLSRNRRHDFFVVKKVTLPRALGVGRYVLKVTIVDEQVKRVAENSIQLQVLAQ